MSSRYELALDLVDGAEALVQAAEEDVEAATDGTMRDVAETRLREALATQDQVLEMVAPTIEQQRQEVVRAGWAAIRSAAGEPGYDWLACRRRWMAHQHRLGRTTRLHGRHA
jgi:hypothetical protein